MRRRIHFFDMAPSWALFPLVMLATAAAVIASQAIISGAFSLTMQAIQLGYIPRLKVNYTSARVIGQIYVPTGELGFDAFLHRARPRLWHLEPSCRRLWRRDHHDDADHDLSVLCRGSAPMALATAAALPVAAFFIIDRSRIFRREHAEGRARRLVSTARLRRHPFPYADLAKRTPSSCRSARATCAFRSTNFLPISKTRASAGCPGRLFICQATAFGIPLALLHNLKHNKVLHGQVAFSRCKPRRSHIWRMFEIGWRWRDWKKDSGGSKSILVSWKSPMCRRHSRGEERRLRFDPMRTTYFIGRETILATHKLGLSAWRGSLFAWMTRNAGDATSYFCLPPNGVVELGSRVEV